MRIIFAFFLFLFSFSTYAATCAFYVVGSPQTTWPSAQDLCTSKLNSSNVASFSNGTWKCSKTSHVITSTGDCSGGCAAGSTFVYSGSVTIQKWANESEYLDLTDQAAAKFDGTTICASKCIHAFDFLGDGEGDLETGPITFSGRYTSTAQSCTTTTSGPTATFSGTKTDGGDTGGGDTGGGDTGGGDTGGGTGGADLGDLKVTIIQKTNEVIQAINTSAGQMENAFFRLSDLLIDRFSVLTGYQGEQLYETRENGKRLQLISEKLGQDDSGDTGSGSTDEKLDTQTGILQQISDKLDTFFSDEGSEEIAALGSESNDSRHQGEIQKSASLFNKLGNLLNFSDRQCVSDFEIDTGVFGIVKIPLSEWCTLMAIIKLFLHLYVLLLCLRMIQRTISEI